MKNWIIFSATFVTIRQADSAAEAVSELMAEQGFAHKPWLHQSVRVREASPEEVETYAARADGLVPSQPTARSVKRKGLRTADRLKLFDS